MSTANIIPMPPVELRRSVGLEGTEQFENPYGVLAFGDDVPAENYTSVLDFGCGCGRVARQMLLQSHSVPARYLGLDLYKPSIDWCQSNLKAAGFEFRHLNAYNIGLNPQGERFAQIGGSERFRLINAHSVFTHIIEPDIEFYFEQLASRLERGGTLRTTWFMFEKSNFPMMQEFQNCIYINPDDLTNATVYATEFVRELFSRHGLQITIAHRPGIRGHQWLLYATVGSGEHVAFEADMAPVGLARPPVSVHGG